VAEDPHQQGRRLGVVLRLREATELSVRVLDGQAQLRRRLFNGTVEAGEHRYEWDGTDDQGRRVEPGSYLVRITGPGVDMSKSLELRPARR
jgi:flagellar hook assembly protein FlgD